MSGQMVFKRTEKKYLISRRQYDNIIDTIRAHTVPDAMQNDRIFSLYFDTPTDILIRRSIDKPLYKEKLRLRSYGSPDAKAQVFAEIKKKYKKVVYKRRAVMNYSDAKEFLATGEIPAGYEDQHQILSEIQWFIRSYPGLAPSILISYDRQAYFGTEDSKLRITFDSNITWSDRKPKTEESTQEKILPDMVSGFSNSSMKNSTACTQMDSGSTESSMNNSACSRPKLSRDSRTHTMDNPHWKNLPESARTYQENSIFNPAVFEKNQPDSIYSCPEPGSKNQTGTSENLPLLDEDRMIMEIKIPGAMPLWLTGLLAENNIYPTSFSKVGTAYKQKLSRGDINYVR